MLSTGISARLANARLLSGSLVCLAVLLLLFGPSVDPGNALAGGDWNDLLYPFFSFTHDVYAGEGRLPLWNPHIFCGQPHLVSLNVLAWYPTELAALLVNVRPSTFYALDLIAHLWLAGTAMMFWLASMGRSRAAAVMGGLFYALGPHAITLAAAGHPHWVRCLAWLPLLFAAVERGKGRLRWMAAAGGVLGLCVLTAAMQFVAMAAGVLGAWILLGAGGPNSEDRSWEGGPGRRGEKAGPPVTAGPGARAAGFLVFAAMAAGVGAVVWVPGFEYYLESVRARAVEAPWAGQWAMSLWDVPALFLPELWGTGAGYFGPHLFRSSSDYPGLLVIFLVAAGTGLAWRSGGRRWVMLGAAALVLALGPATPAGRILADMPVFSGFRTALRWMSFVHVSACVLAAYGWDSLSRAARAGRIRSAARWAIILAVIGAAELSASTKAASIAASAGRLSFVQEHLRHGRVTPKGVEESLRFALRKGGVVALSTAGALGAMVAPVPFGIGAGMAAVVAVADSLIAGSGFFATGPERGEEDGVAKWLASAGKETARMWSDEYAGLRNRRMRDGMEWISGYHGLPLEGYRRMRAVLDSAHPREGLSLLGVRYAVSTGIAPPGWRKVARARGPDGREVTISENPEPMPRAFLAREVIGCRGRDEALGFLSERTWRPGTVPLETPSGTDFPAGTLRRGGAVELRRDGDGISASVAVTSGRAALVVSEVWYPAWRAYVNGERTPVLRACGGLRAVEVKEGANELVMTYDSWCLKIGLMVSFAMAGGLLVLGAAAVSRAP